MAGKTNEEILEAVKSLDPANDEHWTSDGLPRLDAVENLLGAGVTRKQVTNAAPDFNRGHAQSLVDDAHDEETAGPTDEDPDNADAPEDADTEADPLSLGDQDETDDASAADDEDDDTDPLAEGPGDELDDLDDAVNKAQERVDMIRQGLEKGKVMLGDAEADLQKAVDAKNAAFPPLSQAEAIQQFQRNELAKRAEARGITVSSAPSTLTDALRSRRKVRHQGSVMLGQK
jgi:hypothetical protein